MEIIQTTTSIIIGLLAAWLLYGVVNIAPSIVLEPDKKISFNQWASFPLFRLNGCSSPITAILIDILIIAVSLILVNIHGLTLKSFAWLGFSLTLITLAVIDWRTKLLPDFLTIPLVWAGLLASNFGLTGTDLGDSLLGAVIGYLFLYIFYWIFKIATGVEGLGYGDFKLVAAIGAWHGAESILYVVVISSLLGTFLALIQKYRKQESDDGTIPFGPFIVIAGFLYGAGFVTENFKF